MTNLFAKEKRINSTLTKKGRLACRVLMVIAIICFVLGSFGFFDVVYYICNMLGAIVCACPRQALDELITIFPNLISLPCLLYVASVIHRYLRAPSREYLVKLSFKTGIALICIGGVNVIYTIIGWISGVFTHVGINPTLLYPIDTFVLSLIFVGLGILSIVRRYSLANADIPITETNTGKLSNVFKIIFYLAASWAFAAFIYSFSVIDFMHGHIFYSVTLMLMMLYPALLLILYEVFYLPLKTEYRREFLLVFANIALGIALVVVFLYMVALSLDPNAPNDAAYGVLPVEFTASVNAFTYIFGITNIAAPLAAALKAIFGKNTK